MATHSSILAWEIPWTEEPGRLVPRVTERWTHLIVGTHTHTHTHTHTLYTSAWSRGGATETQETMIKEEQGGFPGGSVVKNPPANAGNQVQSLTPHGLEQQAGAPSLCSEAREPQLLRPPAPYSLRSATSEATAATSMSTVIRAQPPSPKLEKSPCSIEDPAQPKINR